MKKSFELDLQHEAVAMPQANFDFTFEFENAILNGIEQPVVSSIELHEKLEVVTPHTKWILRRFEECGHEENQDYLVTDKFVHNSKGGKQNLKNYLLSIACAKDIAMIERTSIGSQVRKYFRDCETNLTKAVNQQALPTKQTFEPLKDSQGNLNVGALVQTTKACIELAEVFKLQGNQALLSADSMAKKLTGVSPMALLDIKHLKNEAQEIALNVTDIGSMVGLSAIRVNKILIEMGYQNKLRDNSSGCNYEPTALAEPYAVLMDTQRRHSNGKPILQLMWNKSIVQKIQDHLMIQGLYVA